MNLVNLFFRTGVGVYRLFRESRDTEFTVGRKLLITAAKLVLLGVFGVPPPVRTPQLRRVYRRKFALTRRLCTSR